jgi:hypothetical protein
MPTGHRRRSTRTGRSAAATSGGITSSASKNRRSNTKRKNNNNNNGGISTSSSNNMMPNGFSSSSSNPFGMNNDLSSSMTTTGMGGGGEYENNNNNSIKMSNTLLYHSNNMNNYSNAFVLSNVSSSRRQVQKWIECDVEIIPGFFVSKYVPISSLSPQAYQNALTKRRKKEEHLCRQVTSSSSQPLHIIALKRDENDLFTNKPVMMDNDDEVEEENESEQNETERSELVTDSNQYIGNKDININENEIDDAVVTSSANMDELINGNIVVTSALEIVTTTTTPTGSIDVEESIVPVPSRTESNSVEEVEEESEYLDCQQHSILPENTNNNTDHELHHPSYGASNNYCDANDDDDDDEMELRSPPAKRIKITTTTDNHENHDDDVVVEIRDEEAGEEMV